mmetsp:Transcript_22096/g.28591  ORF Transcript_22096/g.28591 Transcript_22096/m.28591 type:complete len:203 (+) Transcript_22096:119-727(+)|eukprot:CAMPEP_0198139284 /NCGR_PEP_ID=MMETSP1443-20131203/2618_1 /TAXON_ID=186043 /ORGANISM="Entomoneis sp., Strain CCMP2396" /LENGTH=202 /DNA_ID=CAMNT_0043801373 /DNA_START=42 /DNA_END=650 /DNA_ORIENTATION=+
MADDLLMSENLPVGTPEGLAADNASNTTATDAKIEKDLAVVEEKVDLCSSMINQGEGVPRPSIQSDEAVRAVIGFLEACGPRLLELISAEEGLIGPAALERCFTVQERLIKLLEQIETLALTETNASTTAASASAAAPAVAGVDLISGNFDAASSSPGVKAPPPANAKTTGEEDPFGNVVAPAGKMEDDFDDFFASRQQQGP